MNTNFPNEKSSHGGTSKASSPQGRASTKSSNSGTSNQRTSGFRQSIFRIAVFLVVAFFLGMNADVKAQCSITASSLPTNLTYCLGGSVTLTASTGTTFNWSSPQDPSVNTLHTEIIQISAPSPGSYTYTVIIDGSCTATITLTVVNNPTPVILTSRNQNLIDQSNTASPDTVCSATLPSQLTVSTQGTYAFWSWSNNPTTTTNLYLIPGSGVYDVEVTDNNGCTGTADVVIEIAQVIPQPRLVDSLCSNSTSILIAYDSLHFAGSVGYSYTWELVPNAPFSDLEILTVDAPGTYLVTITNGYGCTGVGTQHVTSTDTPTVTASPVSGCPCASISLNGTAPGVGTYSPTSPYSNCIAGTYAYSYSYTDPVTQCHSRATSTITVNSNTTSSTTVTACDSYTWNGNTYTTSGTHTFSTLNSVGCDSTATLHLTIHNSSTSRTTVTFCDTYTWNGNTYTTSGTHTFSTLNSVGCDSTATLHLTINYSTTTSTTVNACDNYTWNGNTYTTSGTHTFSTLNSVGCDSTATLHLTIQHRSTSSTTVTACDYFIWNGNTYTTSGTHTFDTLNSVGCDSTATLHLTIHYSTTDTVYVTECDSFIWNGHKYTTSGTRAFDTLNSVGCDSVAILHLTIHYSTTSSDTVTAFKNS